MRGKIIVIILVSVILLWVGVITVDCIRLRNSAIGTKPIITVQAEEGNNILAYGGLGYTIKYRVEIGDVAEKDDITYIEQLGYGAEFWLLDKVLVWGWVE